MITLKVDAKKRVVIPGGKPGQVLAYSENGDGSLTLTPVKAVTKEPFPRGSLVKEVEQWNRELAATARKMKIPAPPKDWE